MGGGWRKEDLRSGVEKEREEEDEKLMCGWKVKGYGKKEEETKGMSGGKREMWRTRRNVPVSGRGRKRRLKIWVEEGGECGGRGGRGRLMYRRRKEEQERHEKPT